MAYAHVHIEDRLDDDSVVWYNPGDEVPETVSGYDELYERGVIRDEPYDPESQPKALPDYVEIDGVRYERQTDVDPA